MEARVHRDIYSVSKVGISTASIMFSKIINLLCEQPILMWVPIFESWNLDVDRLWHQEWIL